MAADKWLTHDDGRVFLHQPFDPAKHIPKGAAWSQDMLSLPAEDARKAEYPNDLVAYRARDFVGLAEKWLPLFEQVAGERNLPAFWILAFAYAESRFRPGEEAVDGGWGLMQITAPGLKAGFTKEQVFDPLTNVRIAARVIAMHAKQTQDLPSIASCYNAGCAKAGVPYASDANPWGLRAYGQYLSIVVAANNAAVRWLKEGVC